MKKIRVGVHPKNVFRNPNFKFLLDVFEMVQVVDQNFYEPRHSDFRERFERERVFIHVSFNWLSVVFLRCHELLRLEIRWFLKLENYNDSDPFLTK